MQTLKFMNGTGDVGSRVIHIISGKECRIVSRFSDGTIVLTDTYDTEVVTNENDIIIWYRLKPKAKSEPSIWK